MTMPADQRRRARRLFLLLALLFTAPIAAALLVYYGFPQWQPQDKTHHGELIDPAQPAPLLAFRDADGVARDSTVLRGRWSFLYLGGPSCAQDCRDALYRIRQVRTLLNEKRPRVQRVYVAPDAAALAQARSVLGAEHPDLIFLAPEGATAGALPRFLGPRAPGSLYLLDPLANYLMAYPPDADPRGILADIKRLLRLSQIG
jgi:hypothetical protein